MNKLVLLSLVVLCVQGCTVTDEEHLVLRSSQGEELTVSVEYAKTPEQRRLGLMNRESLPQEHGMLFVFEDERGRAFWMKNTLIPLDIFYFDAAGNMVSMHTMQPCQKDPCTSYPSDAPAQYALELNAGYAAEHGVTTRWKLMLPR